MRVGFIAATLIAAGMSSPTAAATITATYDLKATFSAAANPTVTGKLTASYDPTISGSIQLENFFLPELAAYLPVTALYFVDNEASGRIIFGNNCSSSGCSASSDRNDILGVFSVTRSGRALPGGELLYSVAASNLTNRSLSFSAARAVVTAPVPEPATWLMMILGFALAGCGVRSRTRLLATS